MSARLRRFLRAYSPKKRVVSMGPPQPGRNPRARRSSLSDPVLQIGEATTSEARGSATTRGLDSARPWQAPPPSSSVSNAR